MRTYAGEPYLRAEHLLKDGKYIATKVTIDSAVSGCPVKKGDKDTQVTGLSFVGSDKVLGLNATNFALCCWEFGEGKPESWKGKQVTLVVRLVRNKKLHEPGIRVWPTREHPNIRVREQMGSPIEDSWYATKTEDEKP